MRLHPHEMPANRVPESCRWHVSSGVAHPSGDGSSWCRLPHAVLCPACPAPPDARQLSGLRRSLALRTRRLLDAGVFAPSAAPPPNSPRPGEEVCRPARPVVQLLYLRYLASCPIEEIQCVTQTRRRVRCSAKVIGPGALRGVWSLVPVSVRRGQLALPSDVMAVYSLSALPYQEQLRWRSQRCLQHDATPTAGDLAVADWEPFDPLRHHDHIHTRLPAHRRRPGHGRDQAAIRPMAAGVADVLIAEVGGRVADIESRPSLASSGRYGTRSAGATWSSCTSRRCRTSARPAS